MIFIAGVVLIGVGLVFDQATIGLLRGKLQLWRNAIFAAAKLLILPALTVVFHAQLGLGITFSWVVGAAVSLAIIALYIRLHGDAVLPRPDWGLLGDFAGLQ